eukprot:383797-Ditylum_brightwellii.AAC.1
MQQSAPTNISEKNLIHLLDYLSTYPNTRVQFYTLDMILQIHSNASFLLESKGQSTTGGYFLLVRTLHTILKNVVTSAAKAELARLFLNV